MPIFLYVLRYLTRGFLKNVILYFQRRRQQNFSFNGTLFIRGIGRPHSSHTLSDESERRYEQNILMVQLSYFRRHSNISNSTFVFISLNVAHALSLNILCYKRIFFLNIRLVRSISESVSKGRKTTMLQQTLVVSC